MSVDCHETERGRRRSTLSNGSDMAPSITLSAEEDRPTAVSRARARKGSFLHTIGSRTPSRAASRSSDENKSALQALVRAPSGFSSSMASMDPAKVHLSASGPKDLAFSLGYAVTDGPHGLQCTEVIIDHLHDLPAGDATATRARVDFHSAVARSRDDVWTGMSTIGKSLFRELSASSIDGINTQRLEADRARFTQYHHTPMVKRLIGDTEVPPFRVLSEGLTAQLLDDHQGTSLHHTDREVTAETPSGVHDQGCWTEQDLIEAASRYIPDIVAEEETRKMIRAGVWGEAESLGEDRGLESGNIWPGYSNDIGDRKFGSYVAYNWPKRWTDDEIEVAEGADLP